MNLAEKIVQNEKEKLNIALDLAFEGFKVFPLKASSKTPAIKSWPELATSDHDKIQQWFSKNDFNIGLATGNGLLVIDLDVKNGADGIQSLEDWELINGILPPTLMAKTASGGLHIYYKTSKPYKNKTNIYSGVDLRANGGYVVAPGSEINGHSYEWINDISIATADEKVMAFIEGKDLDNKFILQDIIELGERNETLYKYACSLQSKGLPDEEIINKVIEANNQRCEIPVSNNELDIIIKQALKYKKGNPFLRISDEISEELLNKVTALNPHGNYGFHDKGNGELFADVFKEIARYNPTDKEWSIFDGKIWREDKGGMLISQLAKMLYDALLIYATSLKDDQLKEIYLKHILKLGQIRFRKSMIEDAKDKYFVNSQDLDKDPYILNCQNGTLNLKTFEFHEHSSDALLSKIANVEYIPGVRSLEFEKFMDEIMEGDKGKIEYLQKLFGLALTGDTSQETAYILYGPKTRNGKSTLLETIAHMLGGSAGYALTIQPETLAKKKNSDSRQASGDIARLKGCRMVQMPEPSKRMIFDTALFKSLIASDTITARFLHKSEFEFKPEFKLFINTNYLPVIADESVFTSGRINVITFNRHFKPHEQDKRLKERLRKAENLSGILNWCLEGLKKYYDEGIYPPNSVKKATEDYKLDSDKIGNFINECLVQTIGINTPAKAVYARYQIWCSENGYGAENKGNFLMELRSKGILSPTGTVGTKTVKNVVKNYIIETYDFSE